MCPLFQNVIIEATINSTHVADKLKSYMKKLHKLEHQIKISFL